MTKQRRLHKNALQDARAGLLFVLPWLIGTLAFFVRPFVQVFYYAFHEVSFPDGVMAYGPFGTDTFVRVFTEDTAFVRSFFESILGIFTQSIYVIFFSLFVALILKSEFRGRTLVRAVFFLPVIVATGPVLDVINGDTLAQTMMSGDRTADLFASGSLGEVLLDMGLSAELISTFNGIIDSIFDLSWQSGIQILLFLAALQGVPGHLYEAAQVEGASRWESFWRITLPMITPVLLLNVVYTVIDGFTSFGNTIIKLIVSQTQKLHLSYAAALGASYFLVVFIIILIVYAVMSRFTFYQER